MTKFWTLNSVRCHRGRREFIPLMTVHTKAGSLYYTDDWHANTFMDIRGNHVVIKKDKGNPKTAITSTALKDSGLMPSTGFTILMVYYLKFS